MELHTEALTVPARSRSVFGVARMKRVARHPPVRFRDPGLRLFNPFEDTAGCGCRRGLLTVYITVRDW